MPEVVGFVVNLLIKLNSTKEGEKKNGHFCHYILNSYYCKSCCVLLLVRSEFNF